MAATAISRPTNDTASTYSKMSSPKESKPTVGKNEETSQDKPSDDVKPVTTNGATAQPLAPPPKPTQNNSTDTPDYFSSSHNSSNQFSLEPNPFEQSFGNPSSEAPSGRSILPPVASITSPSPLPGVTPGWNSLRSGPLSPAMLAGPANGTDYFTEGFRGFPTPNESSLRTGLTPGGGGSMFPAPSPNSQHLFNLQSGGVTPSTIDFHRTALSAAAASNQKQFPLNNGNTLQAPDANGQNQADRNQNAQSHQQQQSQQPQQTQQRNGQDMYNQHDVHGAANDLLQFASQANGGNRNGQFAVPNQPAQANQHQGQIPQSSETSPTHRRGTKGSLGTSISGSIHTDDQSESGQSEHAKPSTRSRGKKATNNKPTPVKGKVDDAVKGHPRKKQKSNSGQGVGKDDEESEMEDMGDDDGINHETGKKMTDEEKRKNFLERNRVAALKCRQRKKQWLANLQSKVELFSTENDALSAQVTQLREEVVNLKTLLLAHKDCPVSQAQGLGGINMNSFIGEINNHANPYGIGMQHQMMQMGQGPGQMQRT